jgi:acetyltransferase-like isoleucine patch superfamily enzyme
MIHDKAKIGLNVKFWFPEFSNIGYCEIGHGCIIHSHVWIGNAVRIGSGVRIEAFTFIPPGVTIEDGVFIGPRVTFTNDKHPPSKDENGWQETLVKKDAVLGAGVIVLPGVTIGSRAVVGAGSVVTKNVPDGETWVGNPAHRLN